MRAITSAVILAHLMCPASGQSAAPLTFEVVSVKPTPLERQGRLKTDYCPGGGSFVALGTPVTWSLGYAYRLRDFQVIGAPAWLNSFESTYEIEGKPEGPVTDEQCRQMVQALFADRFKLAAHREIKDTSVYLLTVAKGGSKLHLGGGAKFRGAIEEDGPGKPAWPDGWTMDQLASRLSDFAGRPVVDRTGLKGTYGINLNFSRVDGDDLPDVFTAVQEQLGLKLEPGKAPIGVMVIDHIEKPDAN